jgi:restriction endonuclease S subunit
MQDNNYKYLHFVPLIQLINWSAKQLLNNDFSYSNKYELIEIGTFLTRNKTGIEIENEKEYKRVTIKTNNGGIFLRDIEKGSNIGTKKQFVISEGQFLLSKIDARNGAFGVVPKELDNAVVTNDFPAFDINTNIVKPLFLPLITTTQQFVKFAQSCSSGATNRQRMDINNFLMQRIPLPSLVEQQRMIDNYNVAMRQAESQEQQADALGKKIECYLCETLGIEKQKKEEWNVGKLYFVELSKLTRWDILYFENRDLSNAKSKYETVNLCNIIVCFNTDLKGKSLRIETINFPNDSFKYIGMENIEKGTGLLTEFQQIEGIQVKSQTIKVPMGFIIYGKLRPYLNKYWINNYEYDNIVCSSEFFVFQIVNSINQLYFMSILGSDIVQRQILDLTSGARMPRINEDIFMNIQIPLPPLSVQEKIAKHIQSMKKQIKNLRQSAENCRKKAIEEFEKEIFK